MVEIRYQIVANAGHTIRKALIIGVRYAACRRQFSSIPGTKEERKLLDYQAHMFKLGPILADSYVMCVVGVQLHKFRDIMNEEVKVGKFKTLDFMHHLTSGLKSIYSQTAYDAIDLIRTNCGAAGYSVWSGLP
jgi:acyl-CoA oxidase